MHTKVCWKCKQEKLINFFKTRNSKPTTLCKSCHNKFYTNRKKKKIKNIERNRNYIKEILTNSSCKDCNYNISWIPLQFDHINPENKSYEISKLVSSGKNLELLKTEISKCDIVCANCHFIRTSKMFGSWRLNS